MFENKILYAEDDSESRENYTYFLKQYFQTVYAACDGDEAWRIYEKHKPDILLLDISMPKLDGLQLAKKIRENDYKTHIIMFTAHSDQERLLQAVNLKLDSYLLKPIDDELLINSLKIIVERICDEKNNILIQKDLIWNKSKKTLQYNNLPIESTKKETLLFEILSSNIGAYINRHDIINCVWEDQFLSEIENQKLTQLAYRLNKKILKASGKQEPVIQSSYSFGYKIILMNK